ncbi:DUF2306 domain-containing protein [bacterium]|nr:DUF2306 domain-containing protein [bacterium]
MNLATSIPSAPAQPQSRSWLQPKNLLFALFGLMAIYVLQHNERFIVDPQAPVWNHYQPFKWWLLVHGLGGACAFVLAPMQFSERLRRRYTGLHRIAGRIYVVGAIIAGLTGAYIQFFQERTGGTQSFTLAAATQGMLWMVTTLIAFVLILKGKVQQHRQWMTRSLFLGPVVFVTVRVILGVTGLEKLGPSMIETVVWVCITCAVPVADIVMQYEEWLRSRSAKCAAPISAK